MQTFRRSVPKLHVQFLLHTCLKNSCIYIFGLRSGIFGSKWSLCSLEQFALLIDIDKSIFLKLLQKSLPNSTGAYLWQEANAIDHKVTFAGW